MDEVQLCGDSSASANMVSLIPRKHSLAVSGTPAKTDIKDLMGSLRFLRVPVLPYDNRLWHRLQQSPMRPAFDGLFQTIAVRTTKKEVAGEFEIPHQSRLVVPIELSEIEMHYYNDTLERQRVVLGLLADPSAARPEGWFLDRALFRNSLQNLRQICTHLQVGQMAGAPARMGGRVNRLRLGAELLGLGEVLKKMKDDNNAEMAIASRAQVGDHSVSTGG
jgi:E3 ubiquitin-protein ligase SHPRH